MIQNMAITQGQMVLPVGIRDGYIEMIEWIFLIMALEAIHQMGIVLVMFVTVSG